MPATTANDDGDDGGDRSFLGRRRRANRGCPNVFVLTPSCVLISPPENLGGFGFRAHKKGDSRLTSLEERKVRVFGLLDTRGLTITANLKYVNAREWPSEDCIARSTHVSLTWGNISCQGPRRMIQLFTVWLMWIKVYRERVLKGIIDLAIREGEFREIAPLDETCSVLYTSFCTKKPMLCCFRL